MRSDSGWRPLSQLPSDVARKSYPRYVSGALMCVLVILTTGCQRISRSVREGLAAHAINAGDYRQAAALLEPLARQGDAEAQFSLATLYAEGKGVQQDWRQCALWNQKAADQGLARAQFALGVLYATGEGEPRDPAEAHMWFALAVPRFPSAEATGRADALHARGVEAARLTPEQATQSKKLKDAWIGRHRGEELSLR